MAEEIVYEVTMRDNISGNLEKAKGKANEFERSLESVGERAAHVAEAFGVYEGLEKSIEFIKESTKDYEELLVAQSQLQAGIESTGGAAGETKEQLIEMADKFREHADFAKKDITDMEAQMLRFPAITKETFEQAGQSILDMSQRSHKGLTETAQAVGRALQDPISNMQTLRRYGIMFTAEQKANVQHMIEIGDVAKAQAVILQQMQATVGGSAEAAADANPMFEVKKAMEEAQEAVGHLTTDIMVKLKPAFEMVAHAVQGITEWIQEHPELAEYVGTTLAIMAAGLVVVTAATWAWNVALAANPIGLIVVGVAALIALIIELWQNSAKFRDVMAGTWAVVKVFVDIWIEQFSALYHIVAGIAEVLMGRISAGKADLFQGAAEGADAVKKMFHIGTEVANAYQKGYSEQISKDVDATYQASKKTPPPLGAKGKPGKAGDDGTVRPETKGMKGAKSITITQNIGSLIKEFRITTMNTKDALRSIHDEVVIALQSALNDGQLISGDH
jgi:Prophage tail length tape measure protein